MSYDFTKIETDYPILDTIVDNGKKLMFGCILKDEEEAGKYETLDSARSSNMYILCMRNMAQYSMFNYTKDQLNEVGIKTENELTDYWEIPKEYHEKLLKLAVRDYIANYEEQNNYYRTFAGLPNIGEKGIKITETISGVNKTKYLHEMTTTELNLLEGNGILDKYRELYPDKKYLNYLGTNKQDPYRTRTLPKFGIIDIPNISITDIKTRYKEKIEKNRAYALTCMYSDAMKYENDYYDKFIMMFIKIQSFIDLVMDIPDMIIRKDIFDLRSIQYMLESNGIEYYEEIPLKFQQAMLKNLNKLLTFKSTTKNMIDICSLFGFDNVELFKYYLLKDRRKDKNGNLLFNTVIETNPNTGNDEEVEDYVNNFELKFLKVPIDGIADNYIRKEDNYISYEDMTKHDDLWTAGQKPEDVYREIVEKEFNIERSKYLSIDVVYEMDKLTFEMCYFFNIIFDDVYLEENLHLKIYKISNNPIKLKDAIIYLYLLGYEQYGLEDNIIFDSPTKILSVQGFNFQVDLNELSKYLFENHVSMEDLGITDFTIPDGQILTHNQLVQIYLNNRNVYDHIIKQMRNADNAEVYHIYEHIYEALMITKISDKVFQLPNGEIPRTYTEYLLNYNYDIYQHITYIRKLDKAERDNALADTLIEILSALEDYIDTSEFTFLFMNLPIAGEIIKGYIYKVINFFKSYRVQLDRINTVYKFDDSVENWIKCIDTKHITAIFDLKTFTEFDETMLSWMLYKAEDKIPMDDYVDIAWSKDLSDPKEVFIPKEELDIKVDLELDDFITFMYKTKTYTIVHNTFHERYELEDLIDISYVDE